MKRFFALPLLFISCAAVAQNQPSGATRVQGVRTGYGDPVQVTIVGGGGSTSGGLTDAELRASPINVVGDFYQATQPVSVSGTVSVTGPLTDAQLRASPVSVSGTFYPATQPVSGTFWQATQPVSIATMPTTPVTGTFWQSVQPVSGTVTANVNGTVPVSGTFFQATQPISGTVTANAGSGTFAVSGPLTDTQLRASAVPVSGTVTITPPSLTKGTQGSTGLSTQDLKDAGRVLKVFSATFTGAVSEALVTLTPITDGTAGATGTSFTITSGKRFRIQSLALTVRNAGAAAQGSVVNLRMSASGAVTASSPLIGTVGAGTYLATANVVGASMDSFPDGIELSGTAQFGISQIGTATAGNTVTLIGYEY